MPDAKVTVIARIKVKDGMEEEVKKELMALVPLTRSEPGCINYDLHQLDDDRCTFMFHENWKSKGDLDKHLAMPYLKAFMEKAEGMLAEPVEITSWQMIS
ncbi:MAG: putative quinol monooxygenase [Candidatus Thorarchaeota archaeon]|jgi:quinol monooxygenase YgiN